jgi:16S rRNA (guanine(966)-N(2))-methyltransferase RsmD
MRIIAGTLKGRRLASVPGAHVRPTSDSLRETLFNVLGPTLEGTRVLDAFAGTGALGLEARSRGAAHVTFVEQDPRAVKVIAANVAHCGAGEACAIIRGDFLANARGRHGAAGLQTGRILGGFDADRFDLVLLDPPYAIAELERVVARAAACAQPTGRIVLEHSRRRVSPEAAGAWRRVRLLTAGDSALSFYEREWSRSLDRP